MYDSLLAASRAVKVCSKCQKTKPLTAFHCNSSSVDGRQTYCIACSKQRKKEYSQSEKITVLYKVCSHCGERKKASKFGTNQHTKDNLDHRCLECKRKYDREYKRSAKGIIANRRSDHKRRQKVKQANVEGTYTTQQLENRWNVLSELFGYACPYCARPLFDENRTIDHFIPIDGGGTNQITNIIFCCKRCNTKKRAKNPWKFLRSIGLFREPFCELIKEHWQEYAYELIDERNG